MEIGRIGGMNGRKERILVEAADRTRVPGDDPLEIIEKKQRKDCYS